MLAIRMIRVAMNIPGQEKDQVPDGQSTRLASADSRVSSWSLFRRFLEPGVLYPSARCLMICVVCLLRNVVMYY